MSNQVNYHTNADYRCRIVDNKFSHFMVKQCAVINNYGSKKELYLPQRNIYLKKIGDIEDLDVGDYVTVKLTFENRRTNITSIIDVTKVPKFTKTNEQKESSDSAEKPQIKEINKPQNRFSAFADSSDEEDD